MGESRSLAWELGMPPRDDPHESVTKAMVMMVVKVLTGSTVHFIIHQISLVTWVAMTMKSIQRQTVMKVKLVPVDQPCQVRSNVCWLHNVCDSSNSNAVIKLTSPFYVTSTSLIDVEGVHDVQGGDLHMDSVIRADNTPHDTSPTVTIPVRGC